MHSFAQDPLVNEDHPAHLASRLDLPDGWSFRSEILEEDVDVTCAKHDNFAHVLRDNLGNVYHGSDAGRAFTYLCRQDSLW